MPATVLATCEVYGTIYDVFGVPVEGAIVGVMSVYKNGALVLASTKEVSTDVDGYFTMDLPRDSVAVLYANTPGLNISCLGTPTAIPDADSAELTSIVGDFDLWNEVPVVVPGAAGVNTFNGREGDVVLLASDVTGALGYTPADAAALAAYVPLAGGSMTGFLTLSGNPLSTFHAATKNYVDQSIAAIPLPPPTPPAGTGSELQYRLNATTFGALPSSYNGATNTVHFASHLWIDGYYEMESGAGGTYMMVTGASINPVSIFYAINTAGNPRFIYFGRGNAFATPPLTVPQYMMFYTGTTGSEDVRRMYLSPLGSLVINVQALANQAAALTVNAAGNSTFAKAFQCNGVGEMSADPTTPLGIATRQYVDSHGVSLAADYAWTGNHSWTKPLTVGYTAYDGLALKYPGGTRTPVVAMDPNSIPLMGPIYDAAGAQGGTRVQYLCGSGAWSGTSYGAVNVNDAGLPWTWDFMSHLNVRGSLTLSNNFQTNNALVLGAGVNIKSTANDASVNTWFTYDGYNHIPIIQRENYLCFSGPYGGGLYTHGSVLVVGMAWQFWCDITMADGGTISLYADPVQPNQAATKRYVDKGGAGAVLATYAATYTTDASTGKYFRIPLTGPLTLAAPTGAIDGQTVTWEFVQDTAGGHTVTLDAVFVAGSGGGFTVTPAANARSYFVGAYHASSGKWDILAAAGGYA